MTGESRNREIVIAELPTGVLEARHYDLREGEMPGAGEGDLVVRNVLMSIDAANRAWMQGATYRGAVEAGDRMPTYALAEVVESGDERFAPGTVVATESVWADYARVPAAGAQPATRPPCRTAVPLSHALSLFGIAGKTAYHGLVGVGRPRAGETVVVSAAAGSVGMFAGQIARALGCRVVGIAGGPEKCAWVADTLGFDACVDYRDRGFSRALRGVCPGGIDVYFDNVGGPVLETVLFQMNERGRVVCCGAVSQYNESTPTGPRNLPGLVVVKRLRLEGFIVMDFAERDADAGHALACWLDAGRLRVVEDIVEGLENAPSALIGLLAGENRGKRMVRVGPDPEW